MQRWINAKDRTLAELYTYVLIVYELYDYGEMSKYEYERVKRKYLYDNDTYCGMYANVTASPTSNIFCREGDRAIDVLNDLIAAGAINIYEYDTLKQRHQL